MATATAGTSTATDTDQIKRLGHDYAHAVDTGDLDALVGLFAPDGLWDPSALGMDTAQGSDEIRAFFDANSKVFPASFHLTSNHVVDVDADTATGASYLHAFVLDAAGAKQEVLGRYVDEYVRTSDGWKFQRRALLPLLVPSGS